MTDEETDKVLLLHVRTLIDKLKQAARQNPERRSRGRWHIDSVLHLDDEWDAAIIVQLIPKKPHVLETPE